MINYQELLNIAEKNTIIPNEPIYVYVVEPVYPFEIILYMPSETQNGYFHICNSKAIFLLSTLPKNNSDIPLTEEHYKHKYQKNIFHTKKEAITYKISKMQNEINNDLNTLNNLNNNIQHKLAIIKQLEIHLQNPQNPLT